MNDGPIMRAIRSEEQTVKSDPVVAAKARMLGAHLGGDHLTAIAAMNDALNAGGSWSEVAFALDIVTDETADEYRRLVLVKLRERAAP